MKQHHTPGPWVYEPEWNTILSQDPKGTIAFMLPGGFDEPEHDEVDWDLLRANARLMAAAPELLEFVEDVAEGLNTGGNPGHLEDAVEFLEERAQRIIAKIKGDE